MLTDRDERALILATENRISAPVRIGAAAAQAGAALASVRTLLRPSRPGRERESETCQTPRPQPPYRLLPSPQSTTPPPAP